MSISDKILETLNTPALRYKGMSVNIFGLPILKGYKKNSVHHALARLQSNKYIVFEGSCIKLNGNGKNYLKKRSACLKVFESPFKKEMSRNLLVIFDIAEARKAEREWFRFHLRKFSYVMIQRSVWVGPSPLPKEFIEYLKHIKLIDSIKTFKLAKDYSLMQKGEK